MLKTLRRFRRDDGGVAFMEFALSIPFLLITMLGGLEIINQALTHQQMSRLAAQTADLAARERVSISDGKVNTLLYGALLSITLPDFDDKGRIVLSSFTRNQELGTDGLPTGHWIRWQRCEGDGNYPSAYGVEGDGRGDDSIEDVDGFLASAGNAVIVAEVSYPYEPMFKATGILSKVSPLFQPRELTYHAAFIARDLERFGIDATPGETPKTCE